MIIVDCDVLSCFAKIGRLEFLKELFPKQKFSLSNSVYRELLDAREKGYDFPDLIFSAVSENHKKADEKRWICLPVLSENESKDFLEFKRTTSLGEGELESIAICKNRKGSILLTNDRKAEKISMRNNIKSYNLEALLGLAVDLGMKKEELQKIIDDIETKDNVKLINKGDLLMRAENCE